jgi:RNA polymerase sigma factor (sigma-70 family)
MAQPASSDQKLVQSAVRGNRKAFRELFDRYFQALYNYALTLTRDPALAEDITQEAFIRAHTNLSKLGPPWNFHAWIFRLARNYFIDLVRKERDLEQLEDERQVISPGPSPERETLSREVSDRVHSTLACLPDRQREILVLRELQGFSYAEIGQIMALSDSNVKVSLHRARSAFQESYGISLLLDDPQGDCLEVTQILDALHDGEELLDRERFVKEHLKVCEACQKRRDLLIKQSAILGAFIPVVPPSGLAGRILEQIPGSGVGSALSKGGKIKRILGYGGLAGAMGVTGILAYNILFHTDRTLPNFPGFGGGAGTPAALSESLPGDPDQATPTPGTALNAYSDPVPPAARCRLFEDLEVGAVFLNIREDTMNLPLYFRFEGPVPGFDGQEVDPQPWIFEGELGDILSSNCSLQGFENRLYCLFHIPESMPGTYQALSLHLNGCEGPVVYFSRVSVPEIPVPEKEPSVCTAALSRPACEAAGGVYISFSRAAYCVCP